MHIGRGTDASGHIHLVRHGDRGDRISLASTTDPARDLLREALDAATPLDADTPLVDVVDETRLAPLVQPQKILCLGLNYRDHAEEMGMPLPTTPMMFAKMPSSLTGAEATITWRAEDSSKVDYEAELGVVIGRTARRTAERDALDHVLGYTAVNDVSARDAQKADGQFVRAKSFDTFCPMGNILTADSIGDVQNLAVISRVNGETRQNSSTSQMIFGVAEVIAYISRFMTLVPGDVIVTGTPAGVGAGRKPPEFLRNGDTVEVEIEKLGMLSNPVVVE